MKDKFPRIWVPRVGILEAELVRPKISLSGEYTIKKYKADGRLVQEVGPFSNLITDIGLERMGTGGNSYVFVGTGTTPASVLDTQMNVYLGYTSLGGWNKAILRGGSPSYWVVGSGTSRFNPGAATGNITEVGIGWNSGSVGTMATTHQVFSRALTVDSMGSPITITVLADEYLDVTYSLKYWPPLTDAVQVITISGVSYTLTTRCFGVDAYISTQVNSPFNLNTYYGALTYSGTAAGTPPTLSAYTDNGGLANAGAYSQLLVTRDSYVTGSLTKSAVLSGGLTDANMPYGIRGLQTAVGDQSTGDSFIRQDFQSTITPAIPKDNTKVLSFGISASWGRH